MFAKIFHPLSVLSCVQFPSQKRMGEEIMKNLFGATVAFITDLTDRLASLKKQTVSQHASCNKKLVKANLRSFRNSSQLEDIDPARIICKQIVKG